MHAFSTILSNDILKIDWMNFFYTCKTRTRDRKVDGRNVTRVEARKHSLIFFLGFFSIFPLLLLRTNVPVASDNIYTMLAPCTPENIPPPRRQFLQFINVYISAFNVTTRTFYDTDGNSEMNLSWCILNPPRLLLLRKGWMLYDVINL